MLVLLMVAVTGAWAENYYNVTFGGFDNDYLNTTFTTTLPKSFTEGPYELQFTPRNIVAMGDKITNVNVTYDESEMVEASMIDEGHMSITVSGAFDGNATIQVDMLDKSGEKVSAYITVTCVSAYEAFDVTYDANGGSGAPSAQEKRKDTDLTLRTAVPTRTGYTFAGWNTAQDGSGDSYAPGATYTANADVTLYAQWTAPAPAGYTVSMPQDTPDAEKWTAKAGTDGTYQQLPLEGVAQGAQVSLKYAGAKKVKSVKAVKKAVAPSFTEVTTFSELQTALSAGKNVKLMNDIVCTAEISITSNGALTIDGNGKKLSTTSEIRAFKVGSSATVAFKDLTLTGFVSGGGPAINNSGTIVLDGCTISNCHVNNSNGGGAIENKSNGKLYAINTTFSGNYSGEIGGAINNYNSSLFMSGCTFTDNYTTNSNARYGGAIGINGGSEVRLINCAFSGNKYGTTTGTSDIGVYNKPTNYTIAGCTGAAIASNNGDITTNTTGTATLDYSDLSNISFTYTAE